MTKINLYDALEICLQALDQGADVESCLALFPALAEDLRPILTAAVQARSISVLEVPEAAMRRGRARLLQAAAEMREQNLPRQTALPVYKKRWSFNAFFGARFLRLALTTALMLIFLLTGGTGLVNASSTSLPGDSLYPVKRSWEGVQLFFVLDSKIKEKLEREFDDKRVKEIEELYSEKRIARVDFQGAVQTREGKVWVIGGLNIKIEDDLIVSNDIQPGSIVQVIGDTDDGMIEAHQIILIATPGVTPGIVPNHTPAPLPDASRTPQPASPIDNGSDDDKTPEVQKPTDKPDGDPEEKPTDKPDNDDEEKPTEQPDGDHDEEKPTDKPDGDHDEKSTDSPDDKSNDGPSDND